MASVKIIGARTVLELENQINEWLKETNASLVRVQFETDGIEYPYTAFIMYEVSKINIVVNINL